MTTNANLLTTSQQRLEAAGIATARLDALVLLEDVTGRDRSWLLAHPDFELSAEQQQTLAAQIKRRAAHEPLAYIRGHTEFYGRTFEVNAHTLEPRPETEDMIDLLKSLAPRGEIIDVGTGSGAIGLTAALEIPGLNLTLTDIDPLCLAVARRNAAQHGVKAKFAHGDLLKPLRFKSAFALLCNLPYVPDGHTINAAAMQEPPHAIFGGPDGLDLYRRLFQQLNGRAQYVLTESLPFQQLNGRAQYVLTESLPFQHKALAKIAESAGYRLLKTTGFIQLFITRNGRPFASKIYNS